MSAGTMRLIGAAAMLLPAAFAAAAPACRSCAAAVEPGWRYCPRCGSPRVGLATGPGDAGKILAGWEGPTAKVYRDPASFRGLPPGEARLSLARGEYEAVQIVLYPVPDGAERRVRTLSFEATGLAGRSGAIGAEHLRLSAVGYVHPPELSYGRDHPGPHPDPLATSWDAAPGVVAVREGELQPLWLLVHAPAETPPGLYEGAVVIREGGREVCRARVAARVRGFALPPEMHLPAAFDFYDIRPSYPRRGDESAAAYRDRIEALERAYYVDMLRHRVSPMRNLGYPAFTGIEKGEYRFDFTEFDARHRFYVEEMRQPAFAVAPEWPDWGTDRFEQWKPAKWIGFRNPAALRETFRAIGRHLDERGWIERAYVYSIDEHPGEWTRQICALIRAAHPGLRNLLTIMVQEGYPDVDIWCPRMYELTPERLALGRRFQREGKELWIYTSGPNPPFPTLVLDWDLINCRIIPWMCWKFGLDGYLYWCINYWERNPWTTTATYPGQNGGGFLYYPGAGGPVGTLRLEALRDGLEDYEYLRLLRERVRDARPRGLDEALLGEAERLLAVDDRIVRSFDSFAYDPVLLYNERERIADCIERIDAAVAAADRILWDFEDEGALRDWRRLDGLVASLSPEHATGGERSVRLEFPAAGERAPAFRREGPGIDFTGFDRFEVDCRNPGRAPVRMSIKMKSGNHARQVTFDRPIPPGEAATVSIPLGPLASKLDLADITYLSFFCWRPGEAGVLHLDRIRLAGGGRR
ncbi:MAG: DUF4091 domain-containing protein [bacterium]|nr:DUF4091 domain-containing protein [bacterium]